MYNLGFAVFTVASILLAATWMTGSAAALWLIGMRVVQGVGGAMIFANSSAILTDAFPADQRGLALGINGVAAIAGSFIGLVLGGVLAPVNWHLVFLVSVPFGAPYRDSPASWRELLNHVWEEITRDINPKPAREPVPAMRSTYRLVSVAIPECG